LSKLTNYTNRNVHKR